MRQSFESGSAQEVMLRPIVSRPRKSAAQRKSVDASFVGVCQRLQLTQRIYYV